MQGVVGQPLLAVPESATPQAGASTYEFHTRAYKFKAQLCPAILRRSFRDSQEWLSYTRIFGTGGV